MASHGGAFAKVMPCLKNKAPTAMKAISNEQLDALCRNGTPIDSQGGYPCIVIHPDDTITKIWAQRKRLFSSRSYNPYHKRFVKNAAMLASRGILVPEILNHAVLEGSHVGIVTYRSLPGQSIRDLLKESPDEVDIPGLCDYIFDLHEKGVLFRSIHFGNIIRLPDGSYGLIDFTDVKYFNGPVPLARRAANLAFPLRYQEDVERIGVAKLPSIVNSYLTLLDLDTPARERFVKTFEDYLRR